MHLRSPGNATNVRSEAISEGLRAAGCQISTRSRVDSPDVRADIILQTGFGRTQALLDAIRQGIPYLLAEAPFYRIGVTVDHHSSYNWCGLAGGAIWLPEYPSIPNRAAGICPSLRPMNEAGTQIIVAGQVTNDHSLRGTDHSAWIREKLAQYPEAHFRPHPKMASEPLCGPVEAFRNASRIITYSSTFGSEALIHGVRSDPEFPGSIAYRVTDRELWANELTYKHGSHDWLRTKEAGELILSHYESARLQAQLGNQEIPRAKMTKIHSYEI